MIIFNYEKIEIKISKDSLIVDDDWPHACAFFNYDYKKLLLSKYLFLLIWRKEIEQRRGSSSDFYFAYCNDNNYNSPIFKVIKTICLDDIEEIKSARICLDILDEK